MADFDLFKVKIIDRYFSILEKGLTLTKRRRMTYCASNRFSRFVCTLIKERKKFLKKEKKDEPLYVGYVYLRPGKFFRSHILLDYLS